MRSHLKQMPLKCPDKENFARHNYCIAKYQASTASGHSMEAGRKNGDQPMTDIVKKATGNFHSGTICFFCRDNENEPFPADYSDPLALLGDISELHLGTAQKEEMRKILSRDIEEEGAEAVWKNRTYRKNIILSFGKLV